MAKMEEQSIYAYLRDIKVDAICFEAGSTVRKDKYYTVQHPKCYKSFNRAFGLEWEKILGALLGCMSIGEDTFRPFIAPVAYRFRKILLAAVIKPPVHNENYDIDPRVVITPGNKYPGYLSVTKQEYVKQIVEELGPLATRLKLKKIVVAPFDKTCTLLDHGKVCMYLADNLDERFIVATKGF